jgi:hypothetical protein
LITKIAIYLSLGLHKGRPSYKEKPSALKTELSELPNIKFFLTFFHFCGTFFPFWIRIRGSRRPKSMRIPVDSDPKYWFKIFMVVCGSSRKFFKSKDQGQNYSLKSTASVAFYGACGTVFYEHWWGTKRENAAESARNSIANLQLFIFSQNGFRI